MTDPLGWIDDVKDKVELHRHLEGSIPLELLWDHKRLLSTEFGSMDALRTGVTLTSPETSLSSVLAMFGLFQEAFTKGGPEFTYECTKRVIEHAKTVEGINLLELRFSPDFAFHVDCQPGEDFPSIWNEHMAAITRAKESVSGIDVGLIAIVSRNYGPEAAKMTTAFCSTHRSALCGFDFAAGETDHDLAVWTPTADAVHALDLPLTSHTGEATPSSYIARSLELYRPLARIGHGCSLADDDELIAKVIAEGVHVECCPLSNWLTTSVRDLATHPVKVFLEKGVRCSINSDDPGLFGHSLSEEWRIAATKIGLSESEILKMNEMAREDSFLKVTS